MGLIRKKKTKKFKKFKKLPKNGQNLAKSKIDEIQPKSYKIIEKRTKTH